MKQDQKLKHKHWQQKGKKENAKSNLKRYTLFYAFCSSYHHVLFLLKDISLFLLCFSLKWRLTFFSAIFVFKMLIYYIVFFYSHILIIIFIVILFFWKKQIGIIESSGYILNILWMMDLPFSSFSNTTAFLSIINETECVPLL